MNAAKKIILLLWLVIVASLGNVSASTPGASENRVWQKSFETLETRQAEPLQTLGGHQENEGAGYDYAVDSLLTSEKVPVHYPTLDDGPQNGTYLSTSSIELKGNFMDYAMFNPNTLGSIYVTLGIVNWNIDGIITNSEVDRDSVQPRIADSLQVEQRGGGHSRGAALLRRGARTGLHQQVV